MATPLNLITYDARQRLTEFSEAFDSALALGPADTWAQRLGFSLTSEAIRTVFPIPLSQAGFRERLGDDTLRALYEVSLSVTPREWVDGVKAKLKVITAPDFIGWVGEPQRIADEWARLPNILVASLLHDNANLDLYRIERDGGSVASAIPLFSAAHPVNLGNAALGTFDNDLAGSVNETLIRTLKQYFRALKGPNGKPLGLRLGSLLVPAALEESFRDLLELDVVVRAIQNVGATENVGGVTVNNRHKGTVALEVGDELLDDNMVYAFPVASSGSKGPAPYVLQTQSAPEEVRYDTDSDFYKDSGDVAVKYTGYAGAAGALPHGVVRVTIS